MHYNLFGSVIRILVYSQRVAEDIDPYEFGRPNDAPTWEFFVFWAHKKERQNDAPAWFIVLFYFSAVSAFSASLAFSLAFFSFQSFSIGTTFTITSTMVMIPIIKVLNALIEGLTLLLIV